VDGDKTAVLLEDPEREFVAASFLKLELLRQPTFHKRKAELAFLEDFFGLKVCFLPNAWRTRPGNRAGGARYLTS
jgi:hypothetical protein